MIRVVVSTPTTNAFGSKRYGHGEELEVPEEAARKWIAAGWVKPVSESEAAERGLSVNAASPEQMVDHRRNEGAEP